MYMNEETRCTICFELDVSEAGDYDSEGGFCCGSCLTAIEEQVAEFYEEEAYL